jgi:hypothetical protein
MAAQWQMIVGGTLTTLNSFNFETLDEYQAFSHSLTYTDTDYPSNTYTVVVTPNQTNPDTVYISGNNISGYYTNVFDMFVKYKTKVAPSKIQPNEFITVKNFREIDLDKLEQVVEYKPDTTPSKNYTYTMNVYLGQTFVTSQVFTQTINNNWDLNKTLLLRYINSTAVPDEALFKQWINSINAAPVKWRSLENVIVQWV